MTRRRRYQSAISLFAFQDVMASVIGVVFFIVLLLSLQIVDDTGQSKLSKSDQELAMQTLQTQWTALQEEKRQLEESIETLLKKMNAMALSRPEDVQETISQLQAQTQYYDLKIQQTTAEIKETLSKLEEKQTEYAAKASQCTALEEANQEIQKKISDMIRHPTITYILDEEVQQKPWLVELTHQGIRAAFHEDMHTVYEFRGDHYKDSERIFLEWARSRNPSAEYFVVLVKPSGLKAFEDSLYSKIQKLGFALGSDYIPEYKEPF